MAFLKRAVVRDEPSAIPKLTRRDRGLLFWWMGVRWALTLAGIAVVLYIAAQIVARTDWMRNKVEAELSRLSGMPVRIDGRIRATESLNLKIRDVISYEGESGLRVGILRIRWRLFAPKGESHVEAVWAENVSLTLTVGADGTIRPSFLGDCGRQAAVYAGLPVLSREATPAEQAVEQAADGDAKADGEGVKARPALEVLPLLRIQNARVRWCGADGEEIASAEGIDITWRTLGLPEIGMNPVLGPGDDLTVSHLRGYAESVVVPPSVHVAGLRLELIHAGTKNYLSHLSATDWGRQKPPQNPAESTADIEMLRDAATFEVE